MLAHSYRLATHANARGQPRAAIVVDERVIDVLAALAQASARPPASLPASVLAVLERWDEFHPRLQDIARGVRTGKLVPETTALSSAQLLAPILYPGTVFCAGAN